MKSKSVILSLILVVCCLVIGTLLLTQSVNLDQVRFVGHSQSTSTTTSEELGLRYYTYSEAALAQAQADGHKVVLYFYAPWCTSCIDLETELDANPGVIPEDLVVLRVNYDAESALKKQYQVVTQHTFVLLDQQGRTLTTWVGGDAQELINKTRIELSS